MASRTAASLALLALAGAALAVSALPTGPPAGELPPARMLADLASVGYGDFLGIFLPKYFVELGGVQYFAASDGIHGRELWRSDGTAAGTWRVTDLCPGACHGLRNWPLAAAGGLVYFVGYSEDHGGELWRSDGTAAGTLRLSDALPGPGGSAPFNFMAVGELLFFGARDDTGARQLWRSDGTPEGTQRVVEIPGPAPFGWRIAPLAEVDGALLFLAPGGLWRSDGTAAGTTLVSDVSVRYNSGGSPVDRNLRPARLGSKLIFSGAPAGTTSYQPWVSDGTPAGTQMLAELGTGSFGSYPGFFTAAGAHVYFRAETPAHGMELWRTDGTPQGTELAADVVPGPSESYPRNLTVVGDRLFFITSYLPTLLHTLDLVSGELVEVAEVPEDNNGSGFITWTAIGDRLLFYADDAATGYEPWISDGTAAGTFLLADLNPGPAGSNSASIYPAAPAAVDGGALLFALGAHPEQEWKWSLVHTDGTTAGTALVTTPDRQASSTFSATIGDLFCGACMTFVAAEGGAFFVPYLPDLGIGLWHSDGSTGGTRMMFEPDEPPSWGVEYFAPEHAAWAGERLFFLREQGVWVSDGTVAGTASLEVGHPWENPFVFAFGGNGYFAAEAGGLLRSDGTPDGLEDLGLTASGAHAAAAETLFLATDSELWKIEGAGGVPEPVTVIGDGDSWPQSLSAVPGAALEDPPVLYFTARTPAEGRELWRSDGTAEGTGMVRDIRPGPEDGLGPLAGSSDLERHAAVVALRPELAFLVADDGVSGEELWVSDGTEDGTGLLADLCPGPCASRPRWLTAAGADRLFFVATTPERGRELWVTDGTEAGTAPLEIVAGEVGATPGHLLWLPDEQRLLFSAWHPETGVELWATDGTPAGTQLQQDIHPGPGSSSPQWLTLSGRVVYLTAGDGVHGFEPWVLHLDGVMPIFADGFESGDAAAWGGFGGEP